MKLLNKKLFVGLFILLAYLSIGVFGIVLFSHMPEAPMVNCPYSPGSYSVCENSLDHINNWQRLSNVIFPALFTLLILAAVLYFITKSSLSNQERHFYRWRYYLNKNKPHSYKEDVIKWLSLFENSPCFSHVRHS